jgi:outer membrane protein TolC
VFSYLFRGGIARTACLVALAAPAWAQAPLSLQEAQRIAVGRSQQLAAQDAASASVREMSVAAGQLPDPVLKLGLQNLPINGPERFNLSRDFMTMRSVGVMQEITHGDKRRLRVERVQREGERIQAERVESTANIQRDTALAWIERRYAQAMVDLIRLQVQEAQLEVQGAEIAYRSGRGSQAEIFASRAALVNLQDKLRQTERQVQAATLMLARWIGPDAAKRPLAGDVAWQRTEAASLTAEEHFRHLPHLAVLAAQVRAAETEVRQAQANRQPDWTVEAMYSQRGSAYSNMVSIGVSIPLQIDRANRQDREVAAKLAKLAEARAKYEDALRQHESEILAMVNDWTAGKERIEQLNAHLLPAARLRTEAALTAYQTAKGPLTAVLAARREEVDARVQVLNLEMETARLWAQLTYLVPDPKALPASKEQP